MMPLLTLERPSQQGQRREVTYIVNTVDIVYATLDGSSMLTSPRITSLVLRNGAVLEVSVYKTGTGKGWTEIMWAIENRSLRPS
jgi:hypothetical protein